MPHHDVRRRAGVACLAMSASLVLARPMLGQAPAAPDPALAPWVRANAIAIRPVDAPYVDSSFAFLRPLVGHARLLEVGELVHGGHEPLAFRNEVIRYAVTHLDVTAIGLESGFNEGIIVDRFIQGGAGDIDSVVRAGFTWEFDRLPENRDLVQWLRDHNARASTKVHFYGLDLTGGQDIGVMPGAAGSVTAALDYLNQLAPGADSGLGAHIRPLMTRFLPDSYPTLTLADRELLKTALARLHHIVATDSARLLRVSSPIAYARALRNAWMAVRLNDMMAAGITDSAGMTHAIVAARDSTMAENALWVLAQAGQHGRVVVFAHNAHVMNAGMFNDGARNRLGQFLRAWLDTNLVILGAATGAIVGGPGGGDGWIGHDPEAHADSASFAAVLASAGLPTFVLDRRTGERIPVVAAALAKAWKLMFVSPDVPYQAVVPHDAFDAIVYFDRVTPAKMRPGP